MTRIATLNGADLLVLPANWWGTYEQDQIWQIRARDNGIWYFVANRWGEEVDDRYSPPYIYNMNDAPSVVVDPNGNLLQIHRAQDDAVPHNTILYQDINIPAYRIGNALTPTYSVNMRKPGAYGELANLYYRRDIGHVEYPGLPEPGVVRVASMAYRPAPINSLSTINRIWSNSHETTDVLVLPGLGVSMIPVDTSNPNWSASSTWSQLRAFVEANGISLLVTSVLELPGKNLAPESLLLVRPGQPPELRRQVHDSLNGLGTGQSPVTVDLNHARVGVLLGRDVLFPEAVTQLAKSGADMVVITSTVGFDAPPKFLSDINYVSDVATLKRTWKVRSNDSVHVTASDWTGTGIIVENGGGYINQTRDANSTTPLAVLNLDTSLVRFKYLNAYESWDLNTLLKQ
jgi:predicted amidohydrolase